MILSRTDEAYQVLLLFAVLWRFPTFSPSLIFKTVTFWIFLSIYMYISMLINILKKAWFRIHNISRDAGCIKTYLFGFWQNKHVWMFSPVKWAGWRERVRSRLSTERSVSALRAKSIAQQVKANVEQSLIQLVLSFHYGSDKIFSEPFMTFPY